MQVQPINDINFGTKNTFLLKSKNAITKQDKDYWKSLHYEAKARLNYLKFQEADWNLGKINTKGSFGILAFLSWLAVMGYRKCKSAWYESKSYCSFPNRFAEPDNYRAKVERNYIIKKGYDF